MTEHLFVYGSLQPGEANEEVLGKIGGSWLPATVRGRLHDEAWGSDLGYPALALDDAADPVHGYVFSSDRLDRHWAELDAFEGEQYERVRTGVQLGDGSSLEAWVYVLRGA